MTKLLYGVIEDVVLVILAYLLFVPDPLNFFLSQGTKRQKKSDFFLHSKVGFLHSKVGIFCVHIFLGFFKNLVFSMKRLSILSTSFANMLNMI